MSYLDRAKADGYAFVTGVEGKETITYVTSDNDKEKLSDPEEKVRAEFWAELIYAYDYPANRIRVEVTIPDRVPTDRADIVIFSDDDCKKPYAVIECKKDGVTDTLDYLLESGRKQDQFRSTVQKEKYTFYTTAAWTIVHGDAKTMLLGNVEIDKLLAAMKE